MINGQSCIAYFEIVYVVLVIFMGWNPLVNSVQEKEAKSQGGNPQKFSVLSGTEGLDVWGRTKQWRTRWFCDKIFP